MTAPVVLEPSIEVQGLNASLPALAYQITSTVRLAMLYRVPSKGPGGARTWRQTLGVEQEQLSMALSPAPRTPCWAPSPS